MTKANYEFSGRLVVVTPLHVGSGDFETRACVPGKEGANAAPEVATVVTDAAGRPYLPPTTLKGLFRRLAEAAVLEESKSVIDRLFGTLDTRFADRVSVPQPSEIEDDDADTKQKPYSLMGAIIFRGATLREPGPILHAPYTENAPNITALAPGLFIAARTSIDPDAGTAKDAGLFFQEMVAPKSVFAFRLLVECSGEHAVKQADADARLVARLLKLATGSDGVAIGKGQADGLGRVRLDPASVVVSKRILDAKGDFKPTAVTDIWKAAAAPGIATSGKRHDLTLVCKGPFLVIDASRASKRTEKSTEDGAPKIQTRPQRLAERLPLLMGTGVSGALRARAQWLEALLFDRGKIKRTSTTPRDAIASHRREVRSVRDLDPEIGLLGPVERLFGATGFRGLLAIEKLVVDDSDTKVLTSVKIDRFSGAPIDAALFSTEAFVGVRLRLSLRLAGRGSVEPSSDDTTLFDHLLDDIAKNGLQLGHGAAKGFGWFELEVPHGRQ